MRSEAACAVFAEAAPLARAGGSRRQGTGRASDVLLKTLLASRGFVLDGEAALWACGRDGGSGAFRGEAWSVSAAGRGQLGGVSRRVQGAGGDTARAGGACIAQGRDWCPGWAELLLAPCLWVSAVRGSGSVLANVGNSKALRIEKQIIGKRTGKVPSISAERAGLGWAGRGRGRDPSCLLD